MRPLKLRLEGFGAYQDLQEICFDDVELFAITGPTGAGKSTLLDAITYALYKSTPRIGSKGLGELKHPGAAQAKVELTFALGDQSWRVVRVLGNENQNRLEYLVGPPGAAGGDWRIHPASEKVKELDSQLVQIVGMDYETFTRAILLPQGEFDLFLHGKPAERRDTLIKLYGLENVRAMRERVGERLKGVREQISRLQGELDALEGAEEERVSALREEIEGLEREEGALARQAEAAERELRGLERRFERFAELDSLRRRQASWQAQAEEVARIAERVEQAALAERVWPQVEALEAAQREAQTAARELAVAHSMAAQLGASLEAARAGYDPAELEEAKAELAQLPRVEEQEARLRRYGGSLELRHPRPLPFDEDRLEVLREAERAFEVVAKLSARQERLNRALEAGRAEVAGAEAQLQEWQTSLETLRVQGVEARQLAEGAEKVLGAERLRQGVLSHRHLLHLGEPCPLCEQVVRTLPPQADAPDLRELEAMAGKARERLEILRTEFKLAQERIKTVQESLPKLRRQLAEREAEAAEAAQELEAARFQLSGLSDPEAARQERLQRLAGLADLLRQITGGASVKAYAERLKGRIATLEANAAEIARLERQAQEARQRVAVGAERERGAQERLRGLAESVTALLEETGFASAEAVKVARREPREVEALKRRQSEHEQEGSFVRKQLERLEAELGGQDPVTEVAVREAKAGLERLKAALDGVKRRVGGRRADLSRLQEQVVRRREALREKAALDRETDLWEQLATDLKGDRFQDFLLRHYQSGLLGRASELIQELSQGRYSLRLEDDEYKVLDRWTETLRPVRTLSGGESFMASLSLALSLSEHLSRGRIGALFLDEGFGTLDSETLDQVASVLEALPTQGRLVGIVTHVEALAERLPARLLVQKSQAGSKVSWRE
jgi:exonuclease SbcC